VSGLELGVRMCTNGGMECVCLWLGWQAATMVTVNICVLRVAGSARGEGTVNIYVAAIGTVLSLLCYFIMPAVH